MPPPLPVASLPVKEQPEKRAVPNCRPTAPASAADTARIGCQRKGTGQVKPASPLAELLMKWQEVARTVEPCTLRAGPSSLLLLDSVFLHSRKGLGGQHRQSLAADLTNLQLLMMKEMGPTVETAVEALQQHVQHGRDRATGRRGPTV